MIKLIGDKLYQWDIGRQIEIKNCENVAEVHFLNLKENTSLILEVNEEMVADIPNILLQMPRDIIGWLVSKSENTSITIHEFTLKVSERQKPSNYVYTETEVKSYESLEKRIKEIEDKGISDEKIAEVVNEYLKENPVGGVSEEQLAEAVNEALTQAKESGEFDGYTPQKGTDYFTNADKQAFVTDVLNALPTWQGGSY